MLNKYELLDRVAGRGGRWTIVVLHIILATSTLFADQSCHVANIVLLYRPPSTPSNLPTKKFIFIQHTFRG